jgi:hypothetical protein
MQKKISRKSAAALGAGLMSMSLTGFAGLLMLAPGANAAESGTAANIESEVVTEEQCEWRIVSVPGSIELSSGGAEYVGAALTLSAEFAGVDDLNVYVTGGEQVGVSPNTNTACTFYSDINPGFKTRPTVVMSTGVGTFDATYDDDGSSIADEGLSFALTDSGLDLAVDDTACATEWVSPTDGDTLVASDSGVMLEITDFTSIGNTHAVDLGLRCEAPLTVSIDIPANLLPEAPGKTYTWSGISLTTTLTPVAYVAP